MLPWLARSVGAAVKDCYLGRWHIHQTSLVQQVRNAGEIGKGALAGCQMIDGEHGVGFAAAKRSLELNDRVATVSGQPLRNLCQQQPHPFRDDRTLKEG